jgi:hypothetical protein
MLVGEGIMGKKKRVSREPAAIRDLSALLKDSPPGAWVALSHDEARIVGTAISMQAAAYQAQLNGEREPVLVRMPLAEEGLAAGVR